jgi:hypothetical protein
MGGKKECKNMHEGRQERDHAHRGVVCDLDMEREKRRMCEALGF